MVRCVKHIFDLAVFVLHANLRLMRISMLCMNGMRMRVQLLDERIRHHCSAEQQ